MAVYLDAVWLLNFCFDAMLLLLTGIILKKKIKPWRMIISALIGSSIVILLFTPLAPFANRPESKLILSCAMVVLAFGFHRFRTFFSTLCTFYFVSFAIGGGMLGAYYFFQSNVIFQDQVILTNSTGFGSPVGWMFVIIGFPIVWYFSRIRFEQLEAKKIFYDQIVEVAIIIENQKATLKGLIDSGNQLHDPITNKPVMIVETEKIKDLLPENIFRIISRKNPLDALSQTVETDWVERLRIIPYRAVGRDHQFLLAIKADQLIIQLKEEKLMVFHPLIGLEPMALSSEGDYQCIIHPKMIQKGNKQHAS